MSKIRGNTQILGESIGNAEIATDAAIAYSKLALETSIVNTDIAAAAAIAYSKLALETSIVNTDVAVAAAVDESKIAMNVSTGHDHDGTNSKMIAGAGEIWNETPTPAADGTVTVFTLASAPNGQDILLHLNGVLLAPDAAPADITEYLQTAGETLVTIGAAPETGDLLLANYGL